jgi:LmbE family N-acetylglucosaminyl deacetylase
MLDQHASKKTQKALIIVAHPDDAEISMGMKIYHDIQQGYNIHIHIHTLSRGAIDNPDIAQQRVKECLSAGEILGVRNYTFSNITDTRFVTERAQINVELFSIIGKVQPDIIYTHYPEDQHLDHRITSEEVLIVAEREVPNICYFRSPYSKNFTPNLFFFGGEQMMEKKCQALRCFSSQNQLNVQTFKNLASVTSHQFLHHRVMKRIQSSHESPLYAELFYLERHIIGSI